MLRTQLKELDAKARSREIGIELLILGDFVVPLRESRL